MQGTSTTYYRLLVFTLLIVALYLPGFQVYADADAAINQPVFAFRFMLGINYRFGE